jgi:hypothetical protein
MLKSEKFDKKENRFCHAFSRDFDFQHCLLKTDFWSGILILPYLITIVYSSAFKVLPCHDSNNPCVNGATCIDVNGAAICACTEGYNGRFCQGLYPNCYNKVHHNLVLRKSPLYPFYILVLKKSTQINEE